MRLSPILILIILIASGCTPSGSAVNQSRSAQAGPPIIYQSDAASAQTEIDLQRYVDPAGRYSISYPSAWLIAPSDTDGFDVFFVENSSDNSTVQSYFALSTQPNKVSLSTFGEYALEGAQSQPGLSNFSLVAEKNIIVNGIDGLEHIMTYSMQQTASDATITERALAHRSAILQNEFHTYSISLIVFQDQLQAYTPTFDAVLTSFQTE